MGFNSGFKGVRGLFCHCVLDRGKILSSLPDLRNPVWPNYLKYSHIPDNFFPLVSLQHPHKPIQSLCRWRQYDRPKPRTMWQLHSTEAPPKKEDIIIHIVFVRVYLIYCLLRFFFCSFILFFLSLYLIMFFHCSFVPFFICAWKQIN